jgi:G3E family GTPase
MDNGCVCCTVRGDLVRALLTLKDRPKKFDHIIIETTGLAAGAYTRPLFGSTSALCMG